MHITQFTTLAGVLAAPALAWNTDVHQQIAYTADELLSHQTKQIVAKILEPEAHGSLGRVAAWADGYRKTDEGAFSSQWHYIDSSDDPPGLCNVYYNRDCTKGGCVVSAMANQTQILKGCIEDAKKHNYKRTTKCTQAAKWVTHFTGDIAQPLHVSGIALGGNDYTVTFKGKETNLHAIWDGDIIYSLANVTSFSNETLSPWFRDNILHGIQHDTLSVPNSEMIACTDPGKAQICPLEWAVDTNAWTCDYVYSQIYNGTDLGVKGGYGEGAWPIVKLQTAKAALRMATWFNRLVDGRYHERDVLLQTVPSWVGGPEAGA